MAVTLEIAGSAAAAGPCWAALPAGGFQSSRAWFESLVEAALPPGARAEFWMVRDGDRPLLLLPMMAGPGREMGSLTTVYTTLYQPASAPDASGADLAAAGAAVGRRLRGASVARLDALDPAWPGWTPLRAGLRAAGLGVRRYDHFGNWHQPVRGWGSYLAGRPGALRETIRRRTRACERDGTVEIAVVTGGAALGPAVADYEAVYARSWKEPEPAPGLAAALLPRAAAAGALRLGVMRAGGQAIAAQYWTVAGGVATVLKLAHDETWRALSPGTVLTAHMIRHVIEQDGVADLDFGRGDDPYKRLWTGLRRQRTGLLVVAPFRVRGLAALLRHDAGRAVRRIRTVGGEAEV